MIKNALSIDVEDYYHVSAFDNVLDRKDWSNISPRVHFNTEKILKILEMKNVKATFFMLGWVAKKQPQLIRKIINEGHELACHGYFHERLSHLTLEYFKNDIDYSKKLLEDLSGQPVLGYRAPSFSINSKNIWVYDVVKEVGFKYSSSVYPIRHDHYGWPEAPKLPFKISNSSITEIPISTYKALGYFWPAGGGGYFRLYPYFFSKWLMSNINNKLNSSCVFYFHPWEIDRYQPKDYKLPLKTKFRHYLNINKMEKKLIKILEDYQWGTIKDVFSHSIST